MISIVEILLIVALGWAVTRGLRWGLGSGRRPTIGSAGAKGRWVWQDDRERPRISDGPVERSVTEEVDARHQVNPPAPPQISPKAKREKRMAELQRLYVADEISVEQYEKELDVLMREDTRKPD